MLAEERSAIKEAMLRGAMGEESAPVALGEVVAGKYRVERVLGTGGMGVVVAATHLELDRPVAIKFLLPAAAKDPEVVARFSREARAAAKIHGEHVARVLDVGGLESGLPFMVMEYLEGGDLADRLAHEGMLPLPEISGYVLEACEALAEAHAAGIVHRDLKPANLFLARRPDRTSRVKLLDFGISKAPVGAAGNITSTQAVMGSPVYMSPEQLVSAKNVDARSDIWSLGVVLYEALAGKPPFWAESMPQIVTRILHTPAPRLAGVRPDLPPAVDALVARCLEKDPGARFANVAELAWALSPFAPDGARAVERIARVLGTPHEAPAASVGAWAAPPSLQAPSQAMPPMQPAYGPPPGAFVQAPRPSAEGWGATQARIPKRGAPWVVLGILGGCAVLGVGGLVALRVLRAEATRAAVSIVAPPSSASAGVTLAPPLETPSATAPPTAAPPAPAPSPEPTIPAHARVTPPHSRPGAAPAPAPTPAPAPAPAPTPAPEPTDPLHMGIK